MDVKCCIGIDVGSSAVKGILLDENGNSLGFSSSPLKIHKPKAEFYEQSSNQVWLACCQTVKKIMAQKLVNPRNIKAIGFAATCSLVVLDEAANPISLNPSQETHDETWNIIMWMDHRAKQQAQFINEGGHRCLRAVGGKISPEMEPPKLLWLKENMPQIYEKAANFMDLADFLTFKATGSKTRSMCCVACKWLYSKDDKWDESFYKSIHLTELTENNFCKIGSAVCLPGSEIPGGLDERAADDLGLLPHTPVPVGLIDAHAGCLGVLYYKTQDATLENLPLTKKLCLIAGTSACHMVFSTEPKYVEGVWGPYNKRHKCFSIKNHEEVLYYLVDCYEKKTEENMRKVVFKDLWLNEAGQSSLAPVLDSVAKKSLFLICPQKNFSKISSVNCHAELSGMLNGYASKHGHSKMVQLGQKFHIWPDYHGNRAPLADPTMSGAILGLRLESDVGSLEYGLGLYLAHIQSFALMTRYIVEVLKVQGGYAFGAAYLSGGLSKNEFYAQAHADACGFPVVVATRGCPTGEMVARGAAILSARAANFCSTLQAAADRLAPNGTVVWPKAENFQFYAKKYEIFRKLGDLMVDVTKTSWE